MNQSDSDGEAQGHGGENIDKAQIERMDANETKKTHA